MKNKTKLSFQPPSWKKLQIMQIFPTATVAVAEGLKSLATAVELRPLVQHCHIMSWILFADDFSYQTSFSKNLHYFSNFRKLGAEHGYSFSIVKTNTELHGIPQRRIRTFYFFWNTPTVPQLTWKNARTKSFSEYLKEIPANATQQDMFMTPGKASERFRPYQFCLEREGLTHR